MQRDNRGSALAWVLILLVIAAVVLMFLLPFAAGSIQNSRRENWRRQAYYTAKSAADMVMEYMIGSSEAETPGAVIITKAKEADPDAGYTWIVNESNGDMKEDMGECEVTVRYQEGVFYVYAEAVYRGQSAGIKAKLTALNKESICYIAVE